MAMHPDSRFPLRPNDQADVIRIFLDLMRERHRAEHPEVIPDYLFGLHNGPDQPWIPRELLDLD